MVSRILLIEDEEFIRDLYKRQLEKGGFAVDAFASGVEGLASLKNNQYDLVVLDIMLPKMSGLEILKKVKEEKHNQSLPVVLLTNLGHEDVIKEGFRLGAEGYLVKSSYSPNQIVEEIRNILNTTRAKAV